MGWGRLRVGFTGELMIEDEKSQRCFLDVVSRVETRSEFLILVCIDILDAPLSGILIKQLLLYTTYKHITLQKNV